MRRLSLAVCFVLSASYSRAGGGVREVPAIEASVDMPEPSNPSVAGESAGALPATAVLAPALDKPEALPASPVAAASAEPPAELKKLRGSLSARGETRALEMADRLYYTDPLTGLPNRAYFLERGSKAMKDAADSAVAMLDMNNFGAVNVGLADAYGIVKGRERADEVLAAAGAALAKLAAKKGVSVSRLSGEEFAVLGPREKVLEFSSEARRMLPPEELLTAAGIAPGGAERRAITAAQARLGRGGQPVGDFTYGVASAKGLSPSAALAKADAALNAAKAGGRRGVVSVAGEDGTASEAAFVDGPAESLPSVRTARPTAQEVADVEARLTPDEKALFQEVVFRDPLTLTRTYDYVSLRAADWNARYADGGEAAVISARNLKQTNDALGHEAGDRYLRRLGAILRRTVAEAREAGLDVQEPVRVASKEFLLVGRDARAVADLAATAASESFVAGKMLTSREVRRVRSEAASRGLVPSGRVMLIGTLRVVSENVAAGGRADVKAAINRAFEALEVKKRAADGGRVPPPAANE